MHPELESYSSHKLLTEELSYIGKDLPLKSTQLTTYSQNIPQHAQTPYMLKKLHTLNKKIIVSVFEELAENVCDAYCVSRLQRKMNLPNTLKEIIQKVLLGYKYDGQFYVNRCSVLINTLHADDSHFSTLRKILINIAESHY